MQSFGAAFVATFLILLLLMIALPGDVSAYVDPGTTGMLAQLLYVLFYGALGVFFYFLRSIKQHMAHAKDFLKRLIVRRD